MDTIVEEQNIKKEKLEFLIGFKFKNKEMKERVIMEINKKWGVYEWTATQEFIVGILGILEDK